ncbi:MAG: OadG family protein [Paludibacter sp.]|nr:OadG family protein [Paludibacter sp.]
MQPLNEAVSIMIVGMITVFFILFAIVLIGNLIITLSNKYLPEEVAVVKIKKTNEPSNNTYAAIEKAIDLVTKGKGKVTNIKKI